MKPRILVFTIALLASFTAAAQSTNPLNYSGRMYVEAIEIIATPAMSPTRTTPFYHSRCASLLSKLPSAIWPSRKEQSP